MDDFYLACDLAYSDGRVKRFGTDERDDADIPQSLEFSTSQPGGFATASVTLPRPPRMRADDAALFAEARFYGPGARTYYEGRVTGLPQVGADSIRLDLEGHAAALDDDETFRAIIQDQDSSHWGPNSTQRRLNLLNNSYGPQDASSFSDAGFETSIDGEWTTGSRGWTEAWYGQGIPIGEIFYTWAIANINPGDASWEWAVRLSSDDLLTVTDWTGNLRAAGPGSGTLNAGASDSNPTPRLYAMVYVQNTGAGGNPNAHYSVIWDGAVRGPHGLTVQGTDPGGYWGSDIIGYILSETAPDLKYTLGDSIEQSTYAIPHLVFLEDTTGAEAIRQVTALGGAHLLPNDWGVYQGKEFFWKSPGTYGKVWRVRRDQTATPTTEGPQSKSRIAGMKISYTDGAGKAHSVGPPNSRAEYETTDLLDTDPSNPATRLSRRFAHRQVGITNQEGALNIGRLLLANANRSGWQGDVEIAGTATDFAGNEYPACEIKAGDRIVIEDDEAPEERPINSTSYSHDSMKLTAHVGELPDSGEVLLAQLVAATDLAVAA